MFLRRVIAHLRKQEWTAVGIDFLIVVIGVFVASLVTDWNVSRGNRQLETEYLSRLHDEVTELSAENTEAAERTAAIGARLQEVIGFFQNGGAGFPATGPHCAAIVRSHIFADSLALPPAIGELIATGRIVLVRDDDLRTQILRIAQATDEFAQLRDDIQIDRLVLARKYPELIRLQPGANDEAICDFAAMAASPRFRNDLLDNSFRFEAYQRVLAHQQASRAELLAALDRELRLQHPEHQAAASGDSR
jgi:hypothetical protein